MFSMTFAAFYAPIIFVKKEKTTKQLNYLTYIYLITEHV